MASLIAIAMATGQLVLILTIANLMYQKTRIPKMLQQQPIRNPQSIDMKTTCIQGTPRKHEKTGWIYIEDIEVDANGSSYWQRLLGSVMRSRELETLDTLHKRNELSVVGEVRKNPQGKLIFHAHHTYTGKLTKAIDTILPALLASFSVMMFFLILTSGI